MTSGPGAPGDEATGRTIPATGRGFARGGCPDSILAEAVPASPGQERLWLVAQADPLTTAYAIPVGYHLRAHITPNRFRTAVAALVSRHDALRTGIIWTEKRSFAAGSQIGTSRRDTRRVRRHRCLPQISCGTPRRCRSICPRRLWPAAYLQRSDRTEPPSASFSTTRCVIRGHSICLCTICRRCSAAARKPGSRAARSLSVAEHCPWLRTPDADRDREYWRRRVGGGVPALDLSHGTRRRDRATGKSWSGSTSDRSCRRSRRKAKRYQVGLMLAAFAALLPSVLHP